MPSSARVDLEASKDLVILILTHFSIDSFSIEKATSGLKGKKIKRALLVVNSY